jgi:hypothetical protein
MTYLAAGDTVSGTKRHIGGRSDVSRSVHGGGEGRYVGASGIDVHYIEAGKGEPLLLLNNGMVSTNSVWVGHPAAYNSHFDRFAER